MNFQVFHLSFKTENQDTGVHIYPACPPGKAYPCCLLYKHWKSNIFSNLFLIVWCDYLDSPIYSNNSCVFVAVLMLLTVQGRAKIRYYITLLKKSSAFNVTISQHNFHYLHYQWMLNPIPGCQCATRACGSAVTNVSIWFKKSLFHIGLSNMYLESDCSL